MQSATVLRDFLLANPVFTLFLALGCGYLVGRLRIASISLGPVAGALLVSLLLGQFGFKISDGAQAVGFALFIFAVGYQAGPRFFEVIRTQGMQYLLLALFVGGVAIGKQKDNRQTFSAGFHQPPGDLSQRRLVERAQHTAVGGQPFVNLQAALVGGEQRGALLVQPVKMRAVLAANHQHIGKARRRQQRRRRPTPFEQGVGGDGHPVRDDEGVSEGRRGRLRSVL